MSTSSKSVFKIAGSAIAFFAVISTADAGPGGSARLIERLDTDGSGTVSQAEYVEARSARLERKFDRRDANEDGFITEDEAGGSSSDSTNELRACVRASLGYGGKPTWEERLAEVDTNLDGAIDLGEYTAAAQAKALETFTELDSDASGDVTQAEFEAAKDARKAERQQRREEKSAAREACADQLGIELPTRGSRRRQG